jgi:small subunit ribosomal protein S1
MSWGRVSHPSELFSIGDEIEVVVLKFDQENERVSLGYKQRTADPWENIQEKYPISSKVKGKVVSLTDYGAFVELENGIEGLIHISEMSWSKRVKHPSKVLTVGETIECVVLDINQPARRISLGLKQIEPNPWDVIEQKYEIGSRIVGKVRNITNFGAFVEVEEGIDGLIHISDMSWTKRINYPSEVLKKGEEVEAVILNIDKENQRLSLGLKQLSPDVWEAFIRTHDIGSEVTGPIIRLTKFGAFVDLDNDIEGLVHVSELSEKQVEDPEKEFEVGQVLRMKITKIDKTERKISLSVKGLLKDEEDEEIRSHMRQMDAPKGTHLEEAMKQAGIIPASVMPDAAGDKEDEETAGETAGQPEAETLADQAEPEEAGETAETAADTDTSEEPQAPAHPSPEPVDTDPPEAEPESSGTEPDQTEKS